MAKTRQQIDVAALLAERRFGPIQLEALALCALALFTAGFDAAVMSTSAPAIARALDLPAGALARAGTGTIAGIVLGVLAGGFGDRTGRRRSIILSLLACGAASLATALAVSPSVFLALRVITGLALGAVLPNALALVWEFMPRRNRLVLTSLAWTCFAAGAAVAGPVADSLLQRYQWPALFLLGALLGIVSTLLLWSLLPDSPPLLAHRGESKLPQLVATLGRISRRYEAISGFEFIDAVPSEPGLGILLLFQRGRARVTLLLWLALFCTAVAAALLAAGAPGAIAAVGLSNGNTAIALALLPVAGLAGGLAFPYLAESIDCFLGLAGGLLLGAVMAGVAALAGKGTLLLVLLPAAAFCIGGGAIALGLFTTTLYPTPIRATGIGWALAAGFVGQGVAALAVPALVALHLSLGVFFGIVAIAALAGAVLAIALALRR